MFLSLILLAFSGNSLVGTKAPEWDNQIWLNSKPLRLSDLRGNVVLIRFFMESGCPMCRASAPHLNNFYNRYKDQGLIVIGMYTPKPMPRKTSVDQVAQFVRDYGFQFPVAVDDEWNTLNKFWLDRVPEADYTSVSFLIDQKGVIRYIHPGGAYSPQDVKTLQKQIEDLLARAN